MYVYVCMYMRVCVEKESESICVFFCFPDRHYSTLVSKTRTCNAKTLYVGTPPLGGGSFRLGSGGGNINRGKGSNFLGGLLLRLPLFIFPPPHPSLKETPPQGRVSYHQHCLAKERFFVSLLGLTQLLYQTQKHCLAKERFLFPF